MIVFRNLKNVFVVERLNRYDVDIYCFINIRYFYILCHHECFFEVKDIIEDKRIRNKKILTIKDPIFDKIKFVQILGYDTLRNETYSTIYKVCWGRRMMGKDLDPFYSLFIDSSSFCMERLRKDKIVFLDSYRKPLNMSKHVYQIETKSGGDCGFINFYGYFIICG